MKFSPSSKKKSRILGPAEDFIVSGPAMWSYLELGSTAIGIYSLQSYKVTGSDILNSADLMLLAIKMEES